MTVCEQFYRHADLCSDCDSAVEAHWAKHPGFMLSTSMFEPTCGELKPTLCERGQTLLDAVTAKMPGVA